MHSSISMNNGRNQRSQAAMKTTTSTRTLRLVSLILVGIVAVVTNSLKEWPRNWGRPQRQRQLQQAVVRTGGKAGMMMSSTNTNNVVVVDDDSKDDDSTDDDVDDDDSVIIENAVEEPPKNGKEMTQDDDASGISGAPSLTPSLANNIPSATPTQVETRTKTSSPTEKTSSPSVRVATTERPTLILNAEQQQNSSQMPSNPYWTAEIPVETIAPTFGDYSPVIQAPTTTISPVGGVNGSDTGSDGVPDGEFYYRILLVPFAVSIEGDEVTNDLGLTNCLLKEMQKNLSHLFNLEVRKRSEGIDLFPRG
jgi:hypothetical protein